MIADFEKTGRPAWLRPGAIVAAVGLHLCGALFLAIPSPALNSADDSIEVTIAQGAPVDQEAPPPPPEPQPPPPDPPPPPPDPTPPPPDPTPPPPDPEPPPPEPLPVVKREVKEAPALPRLPKPKPKPKPVQPPPPEEKPREAPKPGQDQAMDEETRIRATYAGKIRREVEANRISPPFGHGYVVVAFAINAAGNVTSARVARSSGLETLDNIALRMVRPIHPGPPPDGPFMGTVRVNFFN